MEALSAAGRPPGWVVPALPDLDPAHLLQRRRSERLFPFDRPGLELTYFGRNAVWRAVKLLGLEGREVVVPAYHHGVEIEALIDAGARPRFARLDASLELDLDHVRSLIGPRTGALYVIHYLGFPQPVEALAGLAREHGILLIEDCALSLLSADGDRPLGSSGDAAIFCFYKTLPVPHGGGLLLGRRPTSSLPAPTRPATVPALSSMAGSVLGTLERRWPGPGRALRSTAKWFTRGVRTRARSGSVPVGTQHFDPARVHLGMSPLAARALRSAAAREVVHRRRANWLFLHERIGRPDRATWSALPEGVCPLFYAIEVDDKDRALALLWSRGVEAVDFWRFGHPATEAERFPEVGALRQRVVELPCHQDLDHERLELVASAAREALRAPAASVRGTPA